MEATVFEILPMLFSQRCRSSDTSPLSTNKFGTFIDCSFISVSACNKTQTPGNEFCAFTSRTFSFFIFYSSSSIFQLLAVFRRDRFRSWWWMISFIRNHFHFDFHIFSTTFQMLKSWRCKCRIWIRKCAYSNGKKLNLCSNESGREKAVV